MPTAAVLCCLPQLGLQEPIFHVPGGCFGVPMWSACGWLHQAWCSPRTARRQLCLCPHRVALTGCGGSDTAARGLSLQVGALGFCRHWVVLSVVNTEWLQLHGVCVSLFPQLPSSICCRG
jgi:hypothetical protein